MAIAEIALGAQLLGSIFGKKKSDKGYDKYIAFMQQQAAPGLKARQAMLGYLLPRLGKESHLLGIQYKKGKEGIVKAGERAKRRAGFLWKGTGRGLGEATRAELSTRSKLGEHALGYAGAQEAHKAASVSALAPLGEGGPQYDAMIGQGMLGKIQSAEQQYSDFGTMLGDYVGWWQWQQGQKKPKEAI